MRTLCYASVCRRCTRCCCCLQHSDSDSQIFRFIRGLILIDVGCACVREDFLPVQTPAVSRRARRAARLGSAQSQPARAPSETIGHFRRPVAAARDMAEASVAGCHFTTHARAIQIAVKRSKRSGTVTRLAPMTSIALNRLRDDTLASRLYPQSKTKIRQSDASSVSHAKYEYNTDATAKVLLFKNSFIQVVS